MAAKEHTVGGFGAGEVPGAVVGLPVFWCFDLHPVVKALFEQAVFVADAVSVRGACQSGGGFEVAGGQATQSPVTQGGVGFVFGDVMEVESQT